MTNCNHCNKETKNPKYCSRSCSAKESNKVPKRTLKKKCKHCDEIVFHSKTVLCKNHHNAAKTFNRNHIENSTLESYSERDCIKNLHPSSKFSHIRGLCRSWFKHLTKLPCHNCGYDKHVELAHIKPISSFSNTSLIKDINSEENVIQLCRNCHWEFDTGLLKLK